MAAHAPIPGRNPIDEAYVLIGKYNDHVYAVSKELSKGGVGASRLEELKSAEQAFYERIRKQLDSLIGSTKIEGDDRATISSNLEAMEKGYAKTLKKITDQLEGFGGSSSRSDGKGGAGAASEEVPLIAKPAKKKGGASIFSVRDLLNNLQTEYYALKNVVIACEAEISTASLEADEEWIALKSELESNLQELASLCIQVEREVEGTVKPSPYMRLFYQRTTLLSRLLLLSGSVFTSKISKLEQKISQIKKCKPLSSADAITLKSLQQTRNAYKKVLQHLGITVGGVDDRIQQLEGLTPFFIKAISEIEKMERPEDVCAYIALIQYDAGLPHTGQLEKRAESFIELVNEGVIDLSPSQVALLLGLVRAFIYDMNPADPNYLKYIKIGVDLCKIATLAKYPPAFTVLQDIHHGTWHKAHRDVLISLTDAEMERFALLFAPKKDLE